MIAWLIKNVFKVASACIILCTFLSFIAGYVHPKWSTWLTHFGTAYPWLLLMNLALLIFWALNWNRFAIYHSVLLIVGWSYTTAFIGMASALPKSSKAVTVMSHNVGTILMGKNVQSQWDKVISDYITFLKKHGDPDIVCLQECEGIVRDLLLKKSGYPYHYSAGKGTLVLSRYLVDNGSDLAFHDTGNSAFCATVHLKQGNVRLYNLHLQSNYVSGRTDKLLQSGNLEDRQSWQKARDILGAVGSQTVKRAEQAAIVVRSLEKTDAPIVLCGDFNDTPNSYVYNLLSQKLTDSFQEKGRGLGYTFAGSLPLLRIDYVFASEHFRVLDAGVIHKKVSDHYPTYAVIELE
jgi:endonuclease/exonuclease/phosphatase family metal-dependent hydrolase